MLQEIPSTLFTEWQAFDEIEPISLGWRVDLGAARVAMTLANIYRGQAEPFTIGDFMPRFWRPADAEQQTAEDLLFGLKTWMKARNARRKAAE